MGKISQLGNSLYNGSRSIDFVGRKWLWYGISGLIVLLALIGLSVKGLNYSIEFTGGTQYKVTLPSDQVTQDNADALREAVGGLGIPNAATPVVTTSGDSSILVQTEELSNAESAEVTQTIMDTVGATQDDISQDQIGASWGDEVKNRAILGLVIFLVLVILFIWAYFREWKMSAAAIVALAHDLVITVGVYALSGFEVSPATVTGLLTILGFSLYDTVVVFDKVRENTKNLRASRTTYAKAANLAVNQTLVRSINTSIVALIPIGAILYVSAVQLGSSSLKDLALALFVGMAAGAYSSIFIATPLLVQLKSNETEIVLAERRAKARARRNADRYASVPVYKDDLPIVDPDGPGGVLVEDRDDDLDDYDDEEHEEHEEHAPQPSSTPEVTGRGRTVPTTQRPVGQSPASGRQQPTRQPRSKRKGPGDDPGMTIAAREALERLVVDVADFPEPGVVFKDITPLLADHAGFTSVIDALAGTGRDESGTTVVDKVVGMEARGFILAAPVALALGTGFVPVRKAGKLPRETHAVSYALEYGEATLEVHRDAIAPGERVLLVDDVLATGGTVAATRQLVESCGGVAVGVAVLMELSFLPGRATIGDLPLHTLLTV